mmetsp:Transcript_132593/g.264620  ORF Transcript_132593/g.264620 Transcript_132593/m.264620 type:complete len:204 (+) Transcript_132593:756-1367(+)
MAPDKPLRRLQRAIQQLQEGGLTSSIRAHNRDSGVTVHTKVETLVKYAVLGVAEGRVNHRDAGWRQLRRRRKVELQIGIVKVHIDGFLLQLCQHLHAALSLFCHLLVASAEPSYELLQVAHLPLLLLSDGFPIFGLLSTHSDVGIVIATKVPHSLSQTQNCGRRGGVQEGTIMGDNDNGPFPNFQELLKPGHSVHVKMVCWLI